MENAEKSSEKQKETVSSSGYTIEIGENFYKKINNHVYLLRHIHKRDYSKNRWIMEALNEKLSQNLSPTEVPRRKQISLKIDANLRKNLEIKIEYIKKFRNNYSKKKFIMEALAEKLEREEEEFKRSPNLI